MQLVLQGTVTISAENAENASTQASAAKAHELQALNILLTNHAKASQNIALVGNKRIFLTSPPQDKREPLGGGLEVLRGYFLSVRLARSGFFGKCQCMPQSILPESDELDRCDEAILGYRRHR